MSVFEESAAAWCDSEREPGSRFGRCVLVDRVTRRWTVLIAVQLDAWSQELERILGSICRLNPNIVVAGRLTEVAADRLGTLGIPFVRGPDKVGAGATIRTPSVVR